MERDILKKKLAGLSEEERAILKEELGLGIGKKDQDPDLVEGFLKLEKQMKEFDDFIKEFKIKGDKKKGFFDNLFD